MAIDESNESESSGGLDPLDPLASFLPETERTTSSSALAMKTVSSLDEFPPECSSAALEPRTAAAQFPRFRRADALPAHVDPVLSSARSVTRGRVMLLGLVCLAVLLPSLATLGLLRMPRLFTVAPSDPVLDLTVVGIVRAVETGRDTRLVTQSLPVPAPRNPHAAIVTVAPKEPSAAPDTTPSARTSPLPHTTASVALPPDRLSRRDDALQRTLSARSTGTVSSSVTVPEEKARQATPVSSRPIHYGSISVTSQPAGAQVTVDGQLAGVTPLVGWELPARSHVVRIDLDGYDRWSASVRVVAEQITGVVAHLQPIRQP